MSYGWDQNTGKLRDIHSGYEADDLCVLVDDGWEFIALHGVPTGLKASRPSAGRDGSEGVQGVILTRTQYSIVYQYMTQ